MTTNEAVELAKQGKPEGLETLYQMYHQQVAKRCYQVLGSKHQSAVQDMVQQTFLKAHLGLPRFRAASAFSTWLFRIATNECYMFLRQEYGHTTHHINLSLDGLLSEDGGGSERDLNKLAIQDTSREAIERLTREARVKQLLGKVRVQDRLILTEHYLQDKSITELSQQCGVSVVALKARCNKATKRMRAAAGACERGV